MNKPIISVVIATYNEENYINRCLSSLRNQSLPQNQIEIIVVDLDSEDSTRRIAKKQADKVYNFPRLIRKIKIKNYRGAQLNFGVKKSKGEIIFFPDADMTFDSKLSYEALLQIKKNGIDALYIPEIITGKGIFGKIRNFERSFYNTTCIDAVRIVKKSLYKKIGGFDEKNIRFGPDDWDFTKRIKLQTRKISITTNKIYHHEKKLSLMIYFAKKAKYSDTFKDYINKWGKNDPDIKKQFGIYYRFFAVFVENGKWKNFIRLFILTAGMYIVRIGVGIIYLRKSIFQNEKNT